MNIPKPLEVLREEMTSKIENPGRRLMAGAGFNEAIGYMLKSEELNALVSTLEEMSTWDLYPNERPIVEKALKNWYKFIGEE